MSNVSNNGSWLSSIDTSEEASIWIWKNSSRGSDSLISITPLSLSSSFFWSSSSGGGGSIESSSKLSLGGSNP